MESDAPWAPKGVSPALPTREGAPPRNFIKPCLLLLLKESPSYGYELLDRLPPLGIGRDYGSLYRALRALEQEGLVRSGWEPRGKGPERRRYEVTHAGEAWLEQWAGAISATQSLLEVYLRRYEDVQSREAGGAGSRHRRPDRPEPAVPLASRAVPPP